MKLTEAEIWLEAAIFRAIYLATGCDRAEVVRRKRDHAHVVLRKVFAYIARSYWVYPDKIGVMLERSRCDVIHLTRSLDDDLRFDEAFAHFYHLVQKKLTEVDN